MLPHPLDGPAVAYFCPADFTRGCTIEAQRFNDIYDDGRAAGVEVFGVSTQDEESHAGFSAECGLRFPLVADPGTELTEGLGLMKQYGDAGRWAARVTFLLDAGGVVRNVWQVEDVTEHPAEGLDAARELAAAGGTDQGV